MEVLNKLLPLLMALVMSVNLSGCGNRAGAESSQPAETKVTTSIVQSVDEEKPFELTNSIVIDGHEYSLPTDLESLSESVIVNKDAKAISRIWYKNKSNEIGSCILKEGKIFTIDINYCEDFPIILLSGVYISKDLTYENFINWVESSTNKNMEIGMGDLGYGKTVQIQDKNIELVVLFDNEDRFKSASLQKIMEDN